MKHGGPEDAGKASPGPAHLDDPWEVPEMQRRNIPDWLLAVICLGCLAGILWLCVTAGG